MKRKSLLLLSAALLTTLYAQAQKQVYIPWEWHVQGIGPRQPVYLLQVEKQGVGELHRVLGQGIWRHQPI